MVQYNPPYSRIVSTNVGKTFLKIIDEEFPSEQILHKFSTGTQSKLATAIWVTLSKTSTDTTRKAFSRMLIATKGKQKSVTAESQMTIAKIQKWSVICHLSSNDGSAKQTYIELTENSFKARFPTTRHPSNTNSRKTVPNIYIWELKDDNVKCHITWKIIKQAQAYSNATKRCNICLWAKYYILCKPSMGTLNKRNELVTACRHATKFLLKNFVT